MSAEKCVIQWVDEKGLATPDNNPSIGRVRRKATSFTIQGREYQLNKTEWYCICAKHAMRMPELQKSGWEWEVGE